MARFGQSGRMKLLGALGIALTIGLLAVARLLLAAPEPPPVVEHPPVPSPAGTRLEASSTATATPAPVVILSTPGRPERYPPQAFGELPLLALPGEGSFRPRFALTFEGPSTVPALPETTDVYRLHWPVFTLQSVRELGMRLGLTGSVERLGPGAFQVEDPARGRLFAAHGRLVFYRADTSTPMLPADPQQATVAARNWLDSQQLLPANAGPPQAQALPDGLVRVTFLPEAPQPLITPEPSVTVVLDGAGQIRELNMFWPVRQEVSAYPLADLTTIWEAIQRGDGYIEVDASLDNEPGQRITGQAQLTQLTVGYALAAGSDADEAAFLEPVIIFTGRVQLDGQATPAPIRVYIPAVRGYRWPQG